ncbi:MAG: hypothetical protein P9X27_04705 [Candidatus Kaelpia aquatica]|nr:hypothetical protein [Candidatus Kaelpia aquatica]
MLKYALDIGSTKLRFAAADFIAGELKILGSLTSKVEGYSGGVITDYKKLFFSILKIIKDFEKQYDSKPKKVLLNCSHPDSKFYHLRESFQRNIPERPISNKELERFRNQVLQDKIGFEEKEILIQIEEYIIDGQRGVVNPERMAAKSVEILLSAITIPVNFFNNILSIFSEIGIELEAIIPEAIAKASLYLNSEDKEAGVMLLDLGWSKAKMVLFKGGILRNSIVFESGFDDIFKKFKGIYHLDNIEADRILNEAMVTEKESIMLQSEEGIKEISVENVLQIIDRGFRKNLYFIKKTMDSKEIFHLLARGILITGGSILEYPNLKDIAVEILKQPVVIKQDKASSLSPDYAAVLGMFSYSFKEEVDFNERNNGYSFARKGLGKIYQIFDKYF